MINLNEICLGGRRYARVDYSGLEISTTALGGPDGQDEGLAEQHILASASRLRHIGELMARARATPLKSETANRTEAVLRQTESDRSKLAQELEEIQRLPLDEGSDIVRRGEGLKALLESVGLQLEQALGAVFEPGK